MRAKVIRSYTDKYTMKSIERGSEIEIGEERFSELTTGPLGVFVEKIKEEPPINEESKGSPVNEGSEEVTQVDEKSTESQKDIDTPKAESGNKEKKKAKSKTAEK